MKDLKLYNVLLFLLIISVAGGTYLFPIDLGFISIYLFRLLLCVILFILIIKRDFVLYSGKYDKQLLIVLVIWILYALITFLWSKDYLASIKDVFYLIIGFLTHIVLVNLFHRTNYNYKIFYLAWIIGFLALAIIGLIEVFTAFHLKGNFAAKLLTLHPLHPVRFAAVTTFDNPNNYSLYLAITVALLIPLLKTAYRAFIWIIITLSTVFIVLNNSKILLIGLVVMSIVLLILKYYKNSEVERNVIKIIPLAVLLTGAIFFSNKYMVKEIGISPANTYQGTVEEQQQQQQLPESSVNIRKNLILNGWHFFKESYGMGIGAGMYHYYIEKGLGKYYVSTVRNPHNWVIQILSQYGIIIFLMTAIWMLFVFIFFIKHVTLIYIDVSYYPVVVFGIMMIISYAFVSNSSSSFIQLPVNWVSLSLIAIAADRLIQQKQDHLLRK